jgi:hypothetical protein
MITFHDRALPGVQLGWKGGFRVLEAGKGMPYRSALSKAAQLRATAATEIQHTVYTQPYPLPVHHLDHKSQAGSLLYPKSTLGVGLGEGGGGWSNHYTVRKC